MKRINKGEAEEKIKKQKDEVKKNGINTCSQARNDCKRPGDAPPSSLKD